MEFEFPLLLCNGEFQPLSNGRLVALLNLLEVLEVLDLIEGEEAESDYLKKKEPSLGLGIELLTVKYYDLRKYFVAKYF